jgi:hypothetical protein
MKCAKKIIAALICATLSVIAIAAGAGAVSMPQGPLYADSNNIPCAAGTSLYKTVTVGGQYTINLCAVSTITSSSWWGPSHAVVNSRVSGTFYEFGADYQRATGSTLNVSDGWRPNYAQQYYYDCSKGKRTSFQTDSDKTVTCNTGTFSTPATPGTSNHDMGLALDINVCGSARGGDCIVKGQNVDSLMAKYGLERRLRSNDPVHLDVKKSYYNSGSVDNGTTTQASAQTTSAQQQPEKKGPCSSILPVEWCDDKDGSSIGNIIKLVISLFTGAVVVAGTIGIIICGITWMTARDNEAQVVKAKMRIAEIVVGIAFFILLSFIMNLIIPQSSSSFEDTIEGNTSNIVPSNDSTKAQE